MSDKKYLTKERLGFVGELCGGPLDGMYYPLLFNGVFKHPTKLSATDVMTVPSKVNTDLLGDAKGEGGRRPNGGEFVYRHAVCVFQDIKEDGDVFVPRFLFRDERDHFASE